MYYVSFRKVRALHPLRSRSVLARRDCGGVRPRSHHAGLAQLAEHTEGGAWTEFGCPHAPLWAVRSAFVFTFRFLAPATRFLALARSVGGRPWCGLVRYQRANPTPQRHQWVTDAAH
jgi:hypothetical protein